jgi:hypothetical protein
MSHDFNSRTALSSVNFETTLSGQSRVYHARCCGLCALLVNSLTILNAASYGCTLRRFGFEMTVALHSSIRAGGMLRHTQVGPGILKSLPHYIYPIVSVTDLEIRDPIFNFACLSRWNSGRQNQFRLLLKLGYEKNN